MVARRSRRLERLLGTGLDSIEYEHVVRIIDGRVTENFDLDYKSELYGGSDGAKRELSTDVAALANTAVDY